MIVQTFTMAGPKTGLPVAQVMFELSNITKLSSYSVLLSSSADSRVGIVLTQSLPMEHC